jgi:hypothetical protein
MAKNIIYSFICLILISLAPAVVFANNCSSITEHSKLPSDFRLPLNLSGSYNGLIAFKIFVSQSGAIKISSSMLNDSAQIKNFCIISNNKVKFITNKGAYTATSAASGFSMSAPDGTNLSMKRAEAFSRVQLAALKPQQQPRFVASDADENGNK